ncbi:hypothetical protein Poli38472_005026 [Pythium oligandrum]|uniref:Uncharacterized protein n=1 Tax=Pythium oligandrum TaxID=41045 RepID=A0A8K1FHP1_PYTOL|nr:hypothetical protein Poli38472_005026 [Pythium oligandrum]|eukprot:TMW59957.1 hypothetical protein Poli38472_005026 [Pythium oligandrum]
MKDADQRDSGAYHLVETPRASASVRQITGDDDAAKTKKWSASTAAIDMTKPHEGSETDASDKDPAKATRKYGFFELYRFATPFDKVLLFLGVLCSAANGAMFPLMAIVLGDTMQGFASIPIDRDAVNRAALNYFLIALGLFFSDYFSYVLFHITAERQMLALRRESLKHMLYLNVAWYDSNDALQLSSRLTGDTVRIKLGMGQKLGEAFRFTSQFVVGVIIGFVRSWDLSLAMTAVMPIVAVSLGWVMKKTREKAEWAQKKYAEAGAIAEETLGSMRTVASLNGQTRAIENFKAKTLETETENIALAKVVSLVMGIFLGNIWLMYAVGLWYGGKKVSDNEAEPGAIFAAFYGTLFGTAALAHISPNATAVSQAAGAAEELFKILDTQSTIDASKDEGVIPESCEGAIEAIDLNFTYPSRPDAPILKNYSVKIEAGQTVAFVGASGGGKSTLISLLERFYDPDSGSLLLDGRDIKTLNLQWLRSQIGLVSQEPVLFATTIFENIATGCGKSVTREEVVAAAKLANAHNFIMSLPEQYDTLVGEKGVSLSGGQKQRVAIARAIVREPKILVLDEATSALDAESERVVQAALNDLMDKTRMTTLVIAHRLSTVRRADKIVVLGDGHIVESGTHDELLKIEGGIYRNMFTLQQLHSHEEDEEIALAGVADIEAADATDIQRSSFVSAKTVISESDVESNEYESKQFGFTQLAHLSKNEKRHFALGVFGSAVIGTIIPVSAVLVGGMMTTMTQDYALFQNTQDRSHLDKIYDDVVVYGILYLVGAALIVSFLWLQTYSFKYMGEKLTKRLRDMNFAALCRQNVGFFDDKKHGTGALTADLATNAAKVAVLSGDSQSRLSQGLFSVCAGIVVSFGWGSWELTLIMLAVYPLLLLGNYLRFIQLQKRDAASDELALPGSLASERLSNIRTVISLGIEKESSDRFEDLLMEPLRKGSMEAHINGLALGYSSFIMLATYALCFWHGGKLVDEGKITFGELIKTFMAIMLSIEGVAGATSYLSDARTAFKAGSNILSLHERSVPIDAFDESGLQPGHVEGKLEFEDVYFRYPTRPDVTVLKNYNLTVEAGQTVAFCGPSGGGKSTVISLIERFYDPVRGSVRLDGRDLRELNLGWLRRQVGLVGQEPTLFIGTIADNIAWGLGSEPSQEEIEAAAKMANAHDFIIQFPDGYQTQVGLKGEQLSGGQKQRIAIARAILKDPPILLLDEATSALDSESEKIVQAALDKVVSLKRRTTLIIAHRLSTIRNADLICVVSGSKIMEKGTHTELLTLDGLYAELVRTSSTSA